MGYTLKIGEAIIDYDVDDRWPEDSYVDINATSIKTDDAPAFGEITDYTSERLPSYTSWGDFIRFAGVGNMFGNSDYSLIKAHPGCVPITTKHKELIDEAWVNYTEKYPNATPTYDTDKTEDAHMCRLVWLRYWIHYALEHCKQPVFYNS